jgi:hypothetical protein
LRAIAAAVSREGRQARDLVTTPGPTAATNKDAGPATLTSPSAAGK